MTAPDLVIPVNQAKGALIKVLFEPNTTVVDSATYDITAWAMPYAYGLKAYALKDRIHVTSVNYEAEVVRNPYQANTYGYAIPWSGLNSIKLLSQLLQKGIRLRISEQPFELEGKQFQRGSILVLRTSNQNNTDLWNQVVALANEHAVTITPISSGFVDKGYDMGSSKVRALKARKIGLITGEGVGSNAAGEICLLFLITPTFHPPSLMNSYILSSCLSV